MIPACYSQVSLKVKGSTRKRSQHSSQQVHPTFCWTKYWSSNINAGYVEKCWKGVVTNLNWFKLSSNITPTFSLFSKMLDHVKAVSTLHSNIIKRSQFLAMNCFILLIILSMLAWLLGVWTASAQLYFCFEHLPNIHPIFFRYQSGLIIRTF